MASWLRSLFAAPKATRLADDDEAIERRSAKDPKVRGRGTAGDTAAQYVGAATAEGVPLDTKLAGTYAVAAVPTPEFVARAVGSESRPLRVVVISDTHEFHHNLTLPPGDILLHCGDFLTIDSYSPGFVSNYNLRDFFAWMNRQPFALRIAVGGNHDHQAEKLGVAAMREMAWPTVYLEDELVDVAGLRVFGTPRSTPNSAKSPNRAFQLPNVADAQRWPSALPDTAVVLRTEKGGPEDAPGTPPQWSRHEVPRASLPEPNRVDLLMSHGAPSCKWVRRSVEALKPAVHFCGHVHGMHGVWQLGGGRYTRVASLDAIAAAREHSPAVSPVAAAPVRGTLSVNGASVRGGPMKEYMDPPIAVDFFPAGGAVTVNAVAAAAPQPDRPPRPRRGSQ